jgi:hypothetical protein
MFYWAKTDKYTIKNCHSQNIITNAQKDGKKSKSPSSPPSINYKLKLITKMNNNNTVMLGAQNMILKMRY